MNTKKLLYFLPIFILALTCITACGKSDIFNQNDNYTIGNTAGNLNNDGLFCEYNGLIYFSNSYDNGSLYSMNPDESDIKKLSKISVKSINVDKNRIYYALSGNSSGSGLGYVRKATGLYSMKKNGSSSISYTQDPVGIVTLCGNKLYFQHYTNTTGTDLDVVTTDKKNMHTVVENMVSPASIDNGIMYFAGASDDMYLYKMDTESDFPSVIYARNMYNPVYLNGWVYYIDLVTNYNLCKYNISSGENITLTKDRVDTFNVYDNIICYQRSSASSNPAVIKMNTDGGDIITLADGIYNSINITSNYIYFRSFENDMVTMHAPLYGNSVATYFEPY